VRPVFHHENLRPHIHPLVAYIKRLNNKLKGQDGGDVKSKEFQSGAAAALKKLSANVADYDIYMGESMNNEGMYILVNFREDGVTPFATIWKHGLEEMKV
jgi:Translationally controlled tumour protein